jgi:hypothetical protein
MADSTDRAAAGEEAGGWCNWHRGPALAVARIHTVPRTSGGDSTANSRYACAGCRTRHGLAAILDGLAS